MNIFFYFSYHRKGSRLYVLFCTEKSFKRINRIKIILSFDLDILFRAVLHDVRLVVTMQGIMCPCSHIQMPYPRLCGNTKLLHNSTPRGGILSHRELLEPPPTSLWPHPPCFPPTLATLASSLFFEHPRHAPTSGPLHSPFPFPCSSLPQILRWLTSL